MGTILNIFEITTKYSFGEPPHSVGKERKGKESKAKERKGKEMKGKERKGNGYIYIYMIYIQVHLGLLEAILGPS